MYFREDAQRSDDVYVLRDTTANMCCTQLSMHSTQLLNRHVDKLNPVMLELNSTTTCIVLSPAGKQESWEGLQPAAASELSALLAKISAIASSVGMSGEDSRGGGAQGSHGRRRLPLGHIRAILSRAQANTWVSMQGAGQGAVQAPVMLAKVSL
jgi:hypothetical protein